MIKYFSVKNFFSIKDEIIFEGDLGTNRNKSTPPNNAFVIYGANASGKTNFLKALTFVLTFMQQSFFRQEPDKPIPIEPFALQQDKPTEFKIDILINKYLYSYTLVLTKEKILLEKLERSHKQKHIFIREENSIKYLEDFPKREKEFIERDLQPNVSLISFLSRHKSITWAHDLKNLKVESNVKLEEDISLQKVDQEKIVTYVASYIEDNEKEKNEVLQLLNIADIDIFDIVVSAEPNNKKSILNNISKQSNNITNKQKKKNILEILLSFTSKELYFIHKSQNYKFPLEFKFESSGTKKLFLLALPIFSILKNGGIFIWDEISADLHFKIAEYIIKLFQNSENSQIFCTTHNPALISSCFDKNTIWFTEKENGVTDLYCAADFEELKKKKNLDLETLYKIGRLGAVPRAFYPQD